MNNVFSISNDYLTFIWIMFIGQWYCACVDAQRNVAALSARRSEFADWVTSRGAARNIPRNATNLKSSVRRIRRQSLKGGATVGQWGQTAPTGKRLWGQNWKSAGTYSVLSTQWRILMYQKIVTARPKLAGSTYFLFFYSKEFREWRQKEIRRENILFDCL